MLKKIAIGVGGVTALGAGVVVGSAAGNSRRTIDVKPDRFSVLAKTYDKEVGDTEGGVGIDKIRAELIAKARGNVLETCAGTGRNNSIYDGSKVQSVTLMDASKEMLEEASKKPFSPDIKHVHVFQGEDLSSLPSETFDSVVDTFGLCSVKEPEMFLKDIERVLKPGGIALFLEHGRAESTGPVSKLVNIWLDFRAPSHANYYGCLWNRQVAELVERSNLTVQKKTLHHLGTSTTIEAIKSASS